MDYRRLGVEEVAAAVSRQLLDKVTAMDLGHRRGIGMELEIRLVSEFDMELVRRLVSVIGSAQEELEKQHASGLDNVLAVLAKQL